MSDLTVPTWGYRASGEAKIFDLVPGERLPESWEASPACIIDPGLANADALSAAAQGREYVLPVADPVSGFRIDGEAALVDPDALANALAEIERLNGIIATGTAENERFVAELEEADKAMEAAAADVVTLKASLEAAQADGGFAQGELAEAKAQIDALTADLAKARAELDELTAPPKSGKAK